MAPSSVKKTQQQYQLVAETLEAKLEQMRQKREELDTRAFVVLNEGGQSLSPLGEQPEMYRGDVGSLVSTATDITTKALQIKLSYIHNKLEELAQLVTENPRQATPPELSFIRYEEWLETNQQLFEYNCQLFDLERVKFEVKKKQEAVRQAIAARGGRERADSQLVHSSVYHIQSLLTRLHTSTQGQNTTRVYIQQLLNPRDNKTTFESQKVREYIAECVQYADSDPQEVKGTHHNRYQEFMAILCGYIVEKQREWQREELSEELVYSTVEHYVMPQVKSLILRRVGQSQRDTVLSRQCQTFSDVTLDQLRVKPQLQSKEAVPFIESIAQLRASYFSPTPTDKMYSIVAAAKALYDQLGEMGETSIDGDSFLDLWIYVIIKANVKDMGTNLAFMIDYGNPQLAMGEAGYYLTSLEAAVQFIETLTPNKLCTPAESLEFVVCERAHFSFLCRMPCSGLEMVAEEEELQGYKVAVIQEWALNRARLFRSALLPTANYLDTAKVSVVRVNRATASPTTLQYIVRQFKTIDQDMPGLFCKRISLGMGVFVNLSDVDHQNVIVLPTGDYDKHISDISHILQLLRLGSMTTRDTTADSCLIPASSKEQTLDVPLSPPYVPSERSKTTDGFEVTQPSIALSRSTQDPNLTSLPSLTCSSLWSPYLTVSPEQDPSSLRTYEKEASFTNKGGSSVGSEHRKLVQSSRPVSQDSVGRGFERSWSSPVPPVTGGALYDVRREQKSVTAPQQMVVQVEIHENSASLSNHTPRLLGDTAVIKHAGSESAGVMSHLTVDGHNAERKRRSMKLDVGRKSVQKCGAGKDRELGGEGRKDGENGIADLAGGEGETAAQRLDSAPPNQRVCPIRLDLANPENIFEPNYRKEVEQAFVAAHLYGCEPQSIAESAQAIILQAQMYLQRLNYLSVSYKLSGEYDDITVAAVRTFQSAHNRHEAKFSQTLPENGHLTSPTFQFLRQAFLTIFASMLRLGFDKYLHENFDPLSTNQRDIAEFRDCIRRFQTENHITECQHGALCANTIDKMRHLLRGQRRTFS